MRKDLWREGILLLRDVTGLLEQRQVHIGFDVALGARIAIPVPGPAKIASFFYDANVGDADLLQTGRREQSAKAATDDHRVELFVQRGPGVARIDVGIGVVMLERAGDLPILVVPVGPQALLPFLGVSPAQRGRVEAQFVGSRNSLWFGLRFGSSITPSLLSIRMPGRRSIRFCFGWTAAISVCGYYRKLVQFIEICQPIKGSR